MSKTRLVVPPLRGPGTWRVWVWGVGLPRGHDGRQPLRAVSARCPKMGKMKIEDRTGDWQKTKKPKTRQQPATSNQQSSQTATTTV